MEFIIFLLHSLAIALFILLALRFDSRSAALTLATLLLFFANFFGQMRQTLLSMEIIITSPYITAFMLLLLFLTERKGEQEAYQTLGILFFFAAFIPFAVNLHLMYQPEPFDEIGWALKAAFSKVINPLSHSLIILFPLQLVGIRLWAYLKNAGSKPLMCYLVIAPALQVADTLFCIMLLPLGTSKLNLGAFVSKLFINIILIPLFIWNIGRYKKQNQVSYTSI